MTDPLATWWVHTMGVHRLSGSGAGGDVFTPPLTDDPDPVPCFWNDGSKLVRDANGQEVVSSSQAAHATTVARVPAGSIVVEPAEFGTAQRKVIKSALGDAGDLPVPSHYELAFE